MRKSREERSRDIDKSIRSKYKMKQSSPSFNKSQIIFHKSNTINNLNHDEIKERVLSNIRNGSQKVSAERHQRVSKTKRSYVDQVLKNPVFNKNYQNIRSKIASLVRSENKNTANESSTNQAGIINNSKTLSSSERPKQFCAKEKKPTEVSPNKSLNASSNRRSRSQRSSPPNDSIKMRYKVESAVQPNTDHNKNQKNSFTSKRSSVACESSTFDTRVKATVKHSHSKSEIKTDSNGGAQSKNLQMIKESQTNGYTKAPPQVARVEDIKNALNKYKNSKMLSESDSKERISQSNGDSKKYSTAIIHHRALAEKGNVRSPAVREKRIFESEISQPKAKEIRAKVETWRDPKDKQIYSKSLKRSNTVQGNLRKSKQERNSDASKPALRLETTKAKDMGNYATLEEKNNRSKIIFSRTMINDTSKPITKIYSQNVSRERGSQKQEKNLKRLNKKERKSRSQRKNKHLKRVLDISERLHKGESTISMNKSQILTETTNKGNSSSLIRGSNLSKTRVDSKPYSYSLYESNPKNRESRLNESFTQITQCKYCGRSFKNAIAKTHIPYCKDKAREDTIQSKLSK